MRFTLDEQETTLVYDAKEKQWHIYSNVPAHVRFLVENSLKFNIGFQVLDEEEGQETAIRLVMDQSLVSLKKLFKQKRVLSAEEKARRVEMIKKAREARKNVQQ